VKKRIVALGVLSAAALVPSAQGMARLQGAPLTTEPGTYDDVDVTITDQRIKLSNFVGERGNGAAFHVRNIGTRPHNFALVGAGVVSLSNSGIATPVLKHNERYVLQVYLDARGSIIYRSTVKRDLTKVNMKGRFIIN
jgi:hypothetical protein